MYAAAREPALTSLVLDSAYASMEPIIQHAFGLASPFASGTRVIAHLLYGIDYYTVRPVDVVASIAPRPLLFIQGANDTIVAPSNMTELALAAAQAPHAHVQTWLVPNTGHIEAFHTMKNSYLQRVVAFFTGTQGVQPSTATS